jgi:hypothetical protein
MDKSESEAKVPIERNSMARRDLARRIQEGREGHREHPYEQTVTGASFRYSSSKSSEKEKCVAFLPRENRLLGADPRAC